MVPAVTVFDVNILLQLKEELVILDVRESFEVELCAIPGALHIPLGNLSEKLNEIPKDTGIYTLCHHGSRSAKAAQWLHENGFKRVFNISGGIDAWAEHIDHVMKRY